jgi:hypothetical protein
MIVLWTGLSNLEQRSKRSASLEVGLRIKARQIQEGFGCLIRSPSLVAILVLTVLAVVFILPLRA